MLDYVLNIILGEAYFHVVLQDRVTENVKNTFLLFSHKRFRTELCIFHALILNI